jgi:hypothetical protein
MLLVDNGHPFVTLTPDLSRLNRRHADGIDRTPLDGTKYLLRVARQVRVNAHAGAAAPRWFLEDRRANLHAQVASAIAPVFPNDPSPARSRFDECRHPIHGAQAHS